MKSSKDIILLLVVLIGATAAGMWVLQMDAQVTPAQQGESADAEVEKNAALLYQPNREGRNTRGMKYTQIKTEFETIINTFLEKLAVQQGEYRKKRQAIQDILKPQSMRSFEYVPENDTFARSIMAEMDAEMNAVIAEFAETDREMKELLGRMDPEDATVLLGEWEAMRRTQLSEYEAFFAQERKIFDLYRVILEIYTQSGGAYSVNVENGTVTFEDAQLQAAYEDAINIINDISSRSSAPKAN